MKVHIFIATTRGPVAIQKIYPLDADIPSVVSVRGTATLCPITSAYANFVRRGCGIIEQHFGGASYRVNVSDSIDTGNSWQLGFYLAHAAQHQGILGDGQVAEGDRVLFVTGEVDTSEGRILPVGQIVVKVSQVQRWLSQSPAALDVHMLVPEDNRAELPDMRPVSTHAVGTLQAALTLLPNSASSAMTAVTASPPPHGRRVYTALGLGAVIMAMLVGAAITLTPAPLAPAPSPVPAAFNTPKPAAASTVASLRLWRDNSRACDGTSLTEMVWGDSALVIIAEVHCPLRLRTEATNLMVIDETRRKLVPLQRHADSVVLPLPPNRALDTDYLMLAFDGVLSERQSRAIRGYLFELSSNTPIHPNDIVAQLREEQASRQVVWRRYRLAVSALPDKE